MAKRWSQRALANKMHVAPSAVAQWEGGNTAPRLQHRVDLAELLGIPFAQLLPEAEQPGELLLKDPETVVFVRQYLALPQPVREALLMQVLATAEMLANPAPPAAPAPPAPGKPVKRRSP